VDFCQAVTGALIARVFAESVGQAGGAFLNDDQLSLTLTFSDGSLAHILYTSGGDASLPKERVEAHAGGATAVLDDFKSLECSRNGKVHRSRSLVKDKGHGAALEAFFEAVRTGGPPPVALRSLVETTLATFAAVESMGQGRAVDVAAQVAELWGEAPA